MVPKTAVAAMLLAALTCSGCKTLDAARPPHHPLPIWSTWGQIEKTRFAEYYSPMSVAILTSEFHDAQLRALEADGTCAYAGRELDAKTGSAPAKAPTDPACPEYAKYQSVGLMLSELHCGAYMTAMDRANRHQHFARNLTSDLGTGVNAVLSIFKTAAPVTGVVTTTFGAFENGFKNYDAAYLPGEEVRNARGIFERARQALLARYQADPPTSLAMAEFRINYYASSCSIDWMRRLIDASNTKADADALIVQMGAIQQTEPVEPDER